MQIYLPKQVHLDSFLTAYKEFETAVSSAHDLGKLDYIDDTCDTVDSVFSLENLITDTEVKDKIRTCRIIRNYAQHHPDAERFLCVSDAMFNYLEARTKDILLLNGAAKDIMRRCSMNLTEESTLAEFSSAMAKADTAVYPYKKKDGTFEIASWVDLTLAISNGDKAEEKFNTAHKGKRKHSVKAFYAFQNTPILSLPRDELIVVLTQTQDKVLGLIVPKDLENSHY